MSRMNLSEKLYNPDVIAKISEMNDVYSTKSPFVVEFDPTTVCDLACPGCISGELLNQTNRYDRMFSKEKVSKILQEFIELQVRAVILIGGGEPLSHPMTKEILQTLGQNNIQIGITTNGTFINKYLELIAMYSNWTRVSIDAANEKTFQYLRPSIGGQSKFNSIISNMESLAKIKKGILGYSFLVRTEADGMSPKAAGKKGAKKIEYSNVREIYDAAKIAKEIGCDYFEPKPSYDDDHNLILHGEYDMNIAAEMVERAKELEDENFKVIESINLRNSLNQERIGAQKKNYTKCPAAEMRTLVTPSGVYVCPYFRGNQDKMIGDLRESTLKEIWNSKQRKTVMNNLNPKKDCSKMHCIRHQTNKEIIDIKNKQHKKESIQPSTSKDLFI